MAQTKTAAKPAAKKPAAKKTASKKSSTKKPAAAKKTTPASKAKAAGKKSKQGEEEVTIDRRRTEERRDEEAAGSGTKLERREKVSRRRQIDPTTCERDYSDQEVEFMSALDAYKRRSGRMFPTCSEVLEVIRDLGYTQLSAAEMSMVREQRGETDEPTAESEAVLEADEALAESDELRVD